MQNCELKFGALQSEDCPTFGFPRVTLVFTKKIAMNFIPDLNIGDLTFTPQDANVIRCDVFLLLMPLCLNFPRLSECLQGVLLASVFSLFFFVSEHPKKHLAETRNGRHHSAPKYLSNARLATGHRET